MVFESTATTLDCGAPGAPGCERDINMLGDIFLWNRISGGVTRVNAVMPDLPWLEGAASPAISNDGSCIAFLSRQPVSDADGRDTFDLFITQRR